MPKPILYFLLIIASEFGLAQNVLPPAEMSLITAFHTNKRKIMLHSENIGKNNEGAGLGYTIGLAYQKYITPNVQMELRFLFNKKVYRIFSQNMGFEQGQSVIVQNDKPKTVGLPVKGGNAIYKTFQLPIKFNFNYKYDKNNWYKHIAFVPEILLGSRYKGLGFNFYDHKQLNLINSCVQFGLGKKINVNKTSYINFEPYISIPLTSYAAGAKSIWPYSFGVMLSL